MIFYLFFSLISKNENASYFLYELTHRFVKNRRSFKRLGVKTNKKKKKKKKKIFKFVSS